MGEIYADSPRAPMSSAVQNISLAFLSRIRIMRALPLQGGIESIVF
jgi:hypothetical protein